MALPPQRSNSAPDLRVLLSGPVNAIPPAIVARGPMESRSMTGALVPFKAPEVSCPYILPTLPAVQLSTPRS